MQAPSIIPIVDNRWNLGSETYGFANVYAHTVHGVSYSNSLLPNEDDVDNIGSGTSTWYKLYLGSGGISCRGPVEIGGSLSVTGHTALNGGLSVTGDTNLNGTLSVTGKTNLNGGLSVTGGNFGVSGVGSAQIYTTGGSGNIILEGPLTYYKNQRVDTGVNGESGGITFISVSDGSTIFTDLTTSKSQEYTYIATADGVCFTIFTPTGCSIFGSFISHGGSIKYNSNPGLSPGIKLHSGSSIGDRLTLVSSGPSALYITEGYGDWEFGNY